MKEKVKEVLRQHVKQHEYPVDPSEIWAGMQTALKKEEKKDYRKIIGILFSIGFGLLLFGFYFNIDSQDTTSISENENTKLSEDTNQNTQVGIKQTSTDISNSNIIDQEVSNKKILANEIADEKIVATNKPDDSSQVNEKIKKAKSSIQVAQNRIEQIGNIVEKQAENSGIERVIKRTEQLILNPSNITVQETNSEVEDEQELSNEVNENTNLKKPEDSLIEKKGFENADKIFAEAPRSKVDVLISLYLIKSLGLKHANEPVVMAGQFTTIDVEKLRSKRSAVSLIASAGLFTKRLTANKEEHSAYANSRESYEVPLEVFSAQALYTIPFFDKLNISTGLNYMVFNEEMNWSGTYVVDAQGQYISETTEYILGQNYYQEVNHSLVNYNQSKLISIPVLIGFSDRHRRISYGFKSGVNFQTRSNIAGFTLDENLVPTNSFDQNFGIGFQSKIELGYFIKPSLQIVVDFSTMQLTAKEELLSQRLYSYSLGLGLSKTL